MINENGKYIFLADDISKMFRVCSTYIIGQLDSLIRIKFVAFSIECTNGGSMFVIDGWEMQDEFFPSTADTKYDVDNLKPFCMPVRDFYPEYVFVSSQNVAQIQFRVTGPGQGFIADIEITPNPRPCNAVAMSPIGQHTLRNYGNKVNCSLSIIYPEKVLIRKLKIGDNTLESNYKYLKYSLNNNRSKTTINDDESKVEPIERVKNLNQNGLDDYPNFIYKRRFVLKRNMMGAKFTPLYRSEKETSKCFQIGRRDYVEFKEGNGLDPIRMDTLIDMCGINPNLNMQVELKKEHSVIRLVSSGDYDNFITFEYEKLDI
ncbi:unnamed protein product [Gordionus sp. m RMFG-2023]